MRRGARLLGLPLTRRRRARDRAARPRHAARGGTAAPPRARFRLRRGRWRGRCEDRRRRAVAARSRRARARCARPSLSAADRRELWRRAGRGRDHRRGPVGAARRDRGDHRALSVAAGLHRAHAARPRADGAGLRPSRSRCSRRSPPRSSPCSTAATNDRARHGRTSPGGSRARRMCCRSASISRTPIAPASSITPTSSNSASAAAPISSGCSASTRTASPIPSRASRGVRRAPRRDRLSQARPHGRSCSRSSPLAPRSAARASCSSRTCRRDGTLLARARVTVVLVSRAGQTAAPRARSFVTRFNDSLTKRVKRS